jgi:hypothetical protein
MAKTLTDALLADIRTDVLTHIEGNFNYLGFGTGTVTHASTGTALTSEFERVLEQDSTSTVSTRVVSFFLPSSSGNGNTIAEVGVFDTGTTGANEAQELATLSQTIAKTSDKEIWVDIEIESTITEN